MMSTFNDKYRIPAIAINSTMDGQELSTAIKDILGKKYRIMLISPETLLSDRIRNELLLNSTFKQLIISFIVDEAHCVSVWGSGFRKKYGLLHVIRTYLPKVPVVAMSATLAPRVLRDVTAKLHMGQRYAFINVGNERPDLSIIVRRIQLPMSTFKNLAFIFNRVINHPHDIPKTFIFLDNKTQSYRAIQALNTFLPKHLQGLGLIRPFNARHSLKYRTDALNQFKKGNIRLFLCTDSVGMGCDIPDVELVVQWCVVSLSALIQRWGRAARGEGRTGRVVLLAEKSAYNYNPTIPGPKEPEAKQPKNGSIVKFKKTLKEPLLKGGFNPQVPGEEPLLQDDSPYEGTLAMVQTPGCLRKIWSQAFHNDPKEPIVKCCSNCFPELLTETNPPAQPAVIAKPSKRVTKKGVLHTPTLKKLFKWRSQVRDRDYPNISWSSAAILSDNLAETLSSVGPIENEQALKHLLVGWGWWDDYGQELAELLVPLRTPFTPLPSQPKTKTSQKRKAGLMDSLPLPSSDSAMLPPTAPTSNAKRTRTQREQTQASRVYPSTSHEHNQDQDLPTNVAESAAIIGEEFTWSLNGYTHEPDTTMGSFESFTLNTFE
ncbi:putative ATP-dependent DNA helicase RecS [Rhizoctonia solani]|uniref:DNA 3'-5' helicase n=1 Tax=Rhizoctonia solani TaxID=456999 RepID=A0A0K6FYB0_9AGAM|nr:putative ATP-dependent DNA helicase RecS [Rhizoctonia solani]